MAGSATAPPKDGTGADRDDAELHRLDTARSTDAAAALTHVWTRRYGPELFGLPRSGVVLDEFADVVMRFEQARTGSVAEVLDDWTGRAGLVQRASAAEKDAASVRDATAAPTSRTAALDATDTPSVPGADGFVERVSDNEIVAKAFISQNCQASILRVFPGEFLGVTLGEIRAEAKTGNAAARRACKLLEQERFRK